MREMRYYQYRQKEFVEEILRRGLIPQYTQYQLNLLAVYLRDEKGVQPSDLKMRLIGALEAMDKHFLLAKWALPVSNAIKYAGAHPGGLLQLDSVTMYKEELDYIQGLDLPDNLQRILWGIMVQKKLDKYSYEHQHGKPYTIFSYGSNYRRMTRLPTVVGFKKKRGYDLGLDVFQPLLNRGLLEVMRGGGDGFKLNFAEQIRFDGTPLITIRDYEHLGLYWDYFQGKHIGFCERCGFPFFRGYKGRSRVFCDSCNAERNEAPLLEEVICQKCGKIFLRSKRCKNPPLCDDCNRPKKAKAK